MLEETDADFRYCRCAPSQEPASADNPVSISHHWVQLFRLRHQQISGSHFCKKISQSLRGGPRIIGIAGENNGTRRRRVSFEKPS